MKANHVLNERSGILVEPSDSTVSSRNLPGIASGTRQPTNFSLRERQQNQEQKTTNESQIYSAKRTDCTVNEDSEHDLPTADACRAGRRCLPSTLRSRPVFQGWNETEGISGRQDGRGDHHGNPSTDVLGREDKSRKVHGIRRDIPSRDLSLRRDARRARSDRRASLSLRHISMDPRKHQHPDIESRHECC